MGDVVNLRLARKRRDRGEQAAAADANRIAYGRSKVKRDIAAAEQDLRERALDGAKRED